MKPSVKKCYERFPIKEQLVQSGLFFSKCFEISDRGWKEFTSHIQNGEFFRTIFGFTFLFLLTVLPLQAIDVLVEAKGGYFWPTSEAVRKIYGSGGIYGIETSCKTYQYLHTYASISYFPKHGKSIGAGKSTSLIYVPIGFGLKYMYPVSSWNFYAGLGLLAGYAHTKDDSPLVVHTLSKWGIGGVIKAGVLSNIRDAFFIDLFSDYSFITIHNHDSHHGKVIPQSANINGWSFGGGIGYRFGP